MILGLNDKYKNKLWCDLKNDRERYEFIFVGRAVETGIMSPSIVDDVYRAFVYAWEFQSEQEDIMDYERQLG